MPFTFAHPAAAVPLRRYFGKHGALSALVIGSMTPDMHYLVPYVDRADSHSIAGLFWFCLPIGLLCYVVFHLVLKLPLFYVLPHAVASRLAPYVRPSALLPDVPRTGVLVSMLAGAFTHLAWDALTHGENFGFRSLDFLGACLFSLDGTNFHTYDLLQDVSSFVGVWLLVKWSLDWFREAPVQVIEDMIPGSWRKRALIVFFFLPQLLAFVLIAEHSQSGNFISVFDTEVIVAMLILAASLVVYGLAWHFLRFFRRV